MTSTWLLLICELSVIACGLVSGVFPTFSDFVMKSLAAANPAGGIESMQIINRKVYKSVFMVLLLGMSALSLLLVGYASLYVAEPASAWITAGGAIYLAGVFVVSLVFNVPRNRRLDAMDVSTDAAVAYWRAYVPSWSFWNHFRAVSSAAAAISFLVACLWLARGAMATG